MQLNKMRGLAREIADRYSKDSGVKGVLAFGSVVTGDIHLGSDLDIVIIEDSNIQRIERQP